MVGSRRSRKHTAGNRCSLDHYRSDSTVAGLSHLVSAFDPERTLAQLEVTAVRSPALAARRDVSPVGVRRTHLHEARFACA